MRYLQSVYGMDTSSESHVYQQIAHSKLLNRFLLNLESRIYTKSFNIRLLFMKFKSKCTDSF
jgi:hypothetical protein